MTFFVRPSKNRATFPRRLGGSVFGWDEGTITPPELEPPVDRVLEAIVEVAHEVTTAKVQEAEDTAAVIDAFITATLPAPPTEGNLLVGVYSARGIGITITPPSGWTLVESAASLSFDGGMTAMIWKLAGPGESDTLSIANAAISHLYFAEFSGAGSLLDSDDADGVAAATALTTGTLSTETGHLVLISAFIQAARAASYTWGSGFAELHEHQLDASGPAATAGWKEEPASDGSELATVTSTENDSYGWIIASFVGADRTWRLAPETHDDDDATYHATVISDDFWRAMLEDAYAAGTCRALIGFNAAASRTVELQGAAEFDFSDAVTLDSVTLTATGSYTGDELAFTVATPASYQFYRLVAAGTYDMRIYTVELYDFDPVSGSADVHIADPTDAHDASAIGFDSSGLEHTDATDVQEALENHDAAIAALGDITAEDVHARTDVSGATDDDVQGQLDELYEAVGWAADVVGALTAGGSPQTVINDATHNAFPGVARLDHRRLLAVYSGDGSNHENDHSICGQIGTLNQAQDAVTWGPKFTILNDTEDLRCEDAVSIVDGQLVIAFRYYTGTGGDNHDPSIIICDDTPEDFTASSTWSSPIALPDPGGTVQEYTQGRVHKVGSTYVLGGGYDSGGTHTVGIWTWTGTLDDPSGAAFTVIGTGANDYAELAFRAMADGVTYRVHMRTAIGTSQYESHSTSLTSGWSTPAVLYTAEGYPWWMIARSGIGLTVYRKSPFGDTAWRQEPDDTDTAWGAETVLDATGDHSVYATGIEVKRGSILVLYGVESAYPPGTNGDIYAQWLTYSSTFGPNIPEPVADAHIADATDAHDASSISVQDAGGLITATDVEAALAELAAAVAAATASSVGGDHLHVIETFNGDGASTVFTIADEPVDAESVFAFVGGSWTAITVSGTDNTTITFGVAPGSGTANVAIHYPAVVAA